MVDRLPQENETYSSNEYSFQIINHVLIPIETEGVWRVDNAWNKDINEWAITNLQRQISHQEAKFNISVSVGIEFRGLMLHYLEEW